MIALLLLACGASSGDSADPCLEPGAICTFAGVPQVAALGAEGVPATESYAYLPLDLEHGPDGLAYYLDWNNHRVRVIDADGIVTTVVGSGELGDGPEGPATEARLNHPTNLAFDGSEWMYAAAWHNSRITRVNLQTGEYDYHCGTGARSYGGDGGPAEEAILDLPSSVAFDGRGQLYIADQANQLIRRIDSAGIIDTIAGQQRVQGFSGDGGPALQAQIWCSVGQAAAPSCRIDIDPVDNLLYLADTDNHRIRVLDLDSMVIDTFAGTGTASFGGDGGPAAQASFYSPADVEVGPDGELYVADTNNSCVRVIRADGQVETVAGRCGEFGFDGDGGPASDALLNRPFGVNVGPDGRLYISDTYNHVIRVVQPG